MLGIPKYDHRDCTIFIIEKLRENGFVVNYIHPNLLFISWKHWVPTYVRNEIKKKTGNNIDEYGNIISKNNSDDNNINNNRNNDDSNYNNLILNNKNSNENFRDKKKSDYKDIKSYNPTGSLIYSNNLLKKLDINI